MQLERNVRSRKKPRPLAQSFLIDSEVVIARDDGTLDFHSLRRQRRGSEAVLFAFNVIEHDGDNLRDELSHGTDKLPPKNWRLRNMPGALSVRERAKIPS